MVFPWDQPQIPGLEVSAGEYRIPQGWSAACLLALEILAAFSRLLRAEFLLLLVSPRGR